MTPVSPPPRLALRFPGRPRAVQSVRFARIGPFLRKYQPQEVVEWKNLIRLQASQQLPRGFAPIADTPLRLTVEYHFAPPKSMPKRDLRAIQAGSPVYKQTRPDLADNLNKGLFDALTGILWTDDSLVCVLHSRKLYTAGPEFTSLVLEPLTPGNPGGNGAATSQRGGACPPGGRGVAPGNAGCLASGMPRSAFFPRNGELPLFDPPPAKNAISAPSEG